MATTIEERVNLRSKKARDPLPSEPKLETILDALRHFSEVTPDRPALIDASCGRTVSYRQLATRVEYLAGNLCYHGVGAGKAVVVVMPRSAALVEMVLAVSRAGGWCIAYMSPRDLERALAVARDALAPELFVYSSQHARQKELARGTERWLAFEEFDASTNTAPVVHVPDGETILYLNETSGSSSNPKLVPASHAAIMANTASCVQTLGITDKDVHLCTFASHVHEIFARALYTGGTAVLLSESVAENPTAFINAMVRHRVTCLMSNATAHAALVELSNYRSAKFSLRLAESGGIPTPETLRSRVADKFGARLVPVWGSTETSGVAIAPPGDRCREGSVGKPLPGYSIKVVDEKGNPVPEGQSGELIVSGEGVAQCYLSGGDGAQLENGTFRTGDRATIDADGWVFIRGRIANEFKVAGVVVSAEEIEAAMSRCEHVRQAAVLPLNHPTYGYVPVALVVPAGNDYHSLSKKSEQRVIMQIIKEAERHLRQLSRQPFLELPTRIKWVWDLPRTPAGKIDRRSLSQIFTEQPPRAIKVRLTRAKRLKLAAEALEGMGLWRLLVRNPTGFARLVRTILKGDKAK
jgi:long-chain acyl-CoA synthetase